MTSMDKQQRLEGPGAQDPLLFNGASILSCKGLGPGGLPCASLAVAPMMILSMAFFMASSPTRRCSMWMNCTATAKTRSEARGV